MPRARFHQEGGAALPVLAEMEIEAGGRVANAQLAVEDAGDKFLRALACEFAVEALLDHRVKTEFTEQLCLHERRRQDEEGDVRPEHGSGMRLESQHQRRNASPLGLIESAL